MNLCAVLLPLAFRVAALTDWHTTSHHSRSRTFADTKASETPTTPNTSAAALARAKARKGEKSTRSWLEPRSLGPEKVDNLHVAAKFVFLTQEFFHKISAP